MVRLRTCWEAMQPVPGNARFYTVKAGFHPADCSPIILLRRRSTCGRSCTSLPCFMSRTVMIFVPRVILERSRTGLLHSTQSAMMGIICQDGTCEAQWTKGKLWLIPPALGCIITSQTQSCRCKSRPLVQHISHFHRGFARLCKKSRPSRVRIQTSIVRN